MKRGEPRARRGHGWATCERSGETVPANERVRDVRGGLVRRKSADITPGFGTHHPADLIQAPTGPDPRPIRNPRPADLEPETAAPDDATRLADLRPNRWRP